MDVPNRKIFRGYDIRGVYPGDLNENVAQIVGQALGSFYLKNGVNEVVVGKDNRISSDSLQQALIAGLVSTGCNVVDVGIALTPMIYFANWGKDYEAAINVTASHNPAQYNGFKTAFKKSIIIGEEILKLIDQGNFLEGKGGIRKGDLKNDYLDKVSAGLQFGKRLKVVFDPGNGTATFFAPALYQKLGLEVLGIHTESDGRYPNHPPDPQLIENYQDMTQLVRERQANLGAAIDGDADRFNFCDDKGEFASGDLLIALFGGEVLRENQGAKVILTALCSQGIVDYLKSMGGEIVIWKVGHAPLKTKIQEEKAVFAGEESGHLYFADRYLGYDDALYASVRLCEIVSKSDKPLSTIVSEVKKSIPTYFATKEYRIECPDEIKFVVCEKVKDQLRKSFEVIDVDGVRFQTGGGWGIIRPSNTEPILSIRAEGKTKEKLSEIKTIIAQSLDQFKPQVNLVWD